MGLILDSSLLIAAERKGSNARQVLSEIAGLVAGEDVAFSVVTLIEPAHGAARAETPERKTTRRQFLQELMAAVPVHPVTVPVALRAGQIDGESTAKGIRIALSDLLSSFEGKQAEFDECRALVSMGAGNFRALILVTGSALNLLFAEHAGKQCTLIPARRAPPVRGEDRVHL
jgi:tRNA(fMet)-specific endonuclease VapC